MRFQVLIAALAIGLPGVVSAEAPAASPPPAAPTPAAAAPKVAAPTPAPPAAAAPTAPKAADCSAPEHHQFDFWIGRWDVFDSKTGERAGTSLIEGLYSGCVIRENWSEPGYAGGSLNAYSETDKKWRQTWADATGGWREFVGGLEDGHMVLIWTHPSMRVPGATAEERMIFTAGADGTVRQFSDASVDGGKTWTERYDYTYRPVKPAQ